MITVVGSANIDLTFRSSRLPKPGETLIGSGYFRGFGGKGANQAVAAARLGAKVAMIGRVGADEFGTSIREQLGREKIDVSHLNVDSHRPTGTAAILVDDRGENSIVVIPGANESVSVADVQAAANVIRSSRVIVAQCETPIEATIEAFRIAHAAGALCVFNPAPARLLPEELLLLVDICVPNETEITCLTGMACATPQQIIDAATDLRSRGPRTVIITMGSRGAYCLGPDGEIRIEGERVAAVDTSGAGDAFCGALAAGVSAGMALHDAIAEANHMAAISVTRLGTQASFPYEKGTRLDP